MREAYSTPELERLSELVALRLGLHFPRERWDVLARGVRSALRELGVHGASPEGGRRLLASPWTRHQAEILAAHLTVGETYFFRDKATMRALTEEILPLLVASGRQGRRRLRIWSAGCASGEEPYSLAILLERLIPDRERWTVTILATDINVVALRKAEAGIYSEWSLRATPTDVRMAYFREVGRRSFELAPRIRERVSFSYHNLAVDPFPSLVNGTNGMDLILCRNVLMYFSPELTRTVTRGLRASLVEGGWLSVGPCEVPHAGMSGFTVVPFGDATLYRKTDEIVRAAESPRVAEEIAASRSVPLPPTARPPAPEPAVHDFVEAMAAGGVDPPPRQGEEIGPGESSGVALPAPSRSGGGGELLVLARECANEGRLDEAAVWCERAVAEDTVDPGRHYLLATIREEQGRLEEAALELRRTLFLDPGFVLAHVALGSIARRRQKGAESRRHFGNALALLRSSQGSDLVPHAGGMTAGRLAEVIATISGAGGPQCAREGGATSAARPTGPHITRSASVQRRRPLRSAERGRQ